MTAFAALLARLDEEARACLELCGLCRRKQQILVCGDPQELVEVVQAEQVMLAALSRSEVARALASRDLAEEVGLPASATVSLLARRLPDAEAAELRVRQDRIAALLGEIRTLNEQNAELIRQSLAYVNFSLDLFARAAGDPGTYAPTGRRPRRAGGPRVLNREA